MADEQKRQRWERASAWPGVAAGGLFLVVYSWNVLQEQKPAGLGIALTSVLAAIWLYFAVDYVVRLALAEDKGRFIRSHPLDLLSVFLPVARPFRLLTGLSRVNGLRGDSGSHLRRRVLIVASAFVVMFIYVIALAEFQVERYAHGSNIRSFGDALWWACVTMSTVGYGDYYPVTLLGRLLAVVLMIGGIAIVGTASATIVSYLTERTQHLRHHAGDGHRERRDDGGDRA